MFSLLIFGIHWKIVDSRFKFDDERVTKEDMKRALEEQYGGEEEVFLPIRVIHKFPFEVMLIYTFANICFFVLCLY